MIDVRQIARLAHLEISDAEVELYTPQMAEIVSYVEQLSDVDTDAIEPMLGGLTDAGAATETIRADVIGSSLDQTAALSEAPTAIAGHFQVPKVL